MNHATLHKTLTKRCGPTWDISFECEDLNISETVTLNIPSLLPAKTIAAILQRAAANKTYQHGQPKHPYLLSGMVFCNACGYVLFGQTNANGHRYYRHPHTPRAKACSCQPRPWVRADQLEDAVLRCLFDAFGNPTAAQRAIEQATPQMADADQLREELAKHQEVLDKAARDRKKIVSLIVRERITDDDVDDELTKINERASEAEYEREWIETCLASLPSPERIRAAAGEISRRFSGRRVSAERRLLVRKANSRLDLMTWKEKRQLVKQVFDGLTSKGKPMGVYIKAIPDQATHRQKQWEFTLRGIPPIDRYCGVTQCARDCTIAALL